MSLGGFFETSAAGSLYRHKRTLKVRVSNTNPETSATGCKLFLQGVELCDYEGPWLLREGFALAAGDHVYVPLARYTEPNDIRVSPYGDSFIEILVKERQPLLTTKQVHILTLRATTLSGGYCEFKSKLWVDESGRLRIESLSVPAEE